MFGDAYSPIKIALESLATIKPSSCCSLPINMYNWTTLQDEESLHSDILATEYEHVAAYDSKSTNAPVLYYN